MKQPMLVIAITVAVLLAGCAPRGPFAMGTRETPLPAAASARCVGPRRASNRATPPTLIRALSGCVREHRYGDALFLYALAGAYTHFDALRVRDPTAHDAGGVLLLQAIQSMTGTERVRLQNKIRSTFSDARKARRVCREIERIGPPQYYPAYMVNPGTTAFTGSKGADLSKDFDPVAAWDEVLSGYLHCSGT
ncbi:MAG: hypothetical protein ACYCQK_06820 [Acidiferrobacteraceae bacterium]